MGRYHLVLSGYKDVYQSPELKNFRDDELYLWLTHSTMHPDDTFYIEVPNSFEKKAVQELINYVFPDSRVDQSHRISELEEDEYPELPELYEFFLEMTGIEKQGDVVLDWSINNGPDNIDLADVVENHLSLSRELESGDRYKIIHLVVDEYDVPFREYENPQDVENDKKEIRGMFLHYLVANLGIENISASLNTGAVKDAVDYCTGQNLIICEPDKNDPSVLSLTLTSQGEKIIKDLEGECDYYNDHYEIFASVFVEDDFIDFDSEEGIDLRMAAMRYDGLNPYRANMIINLFTGVFDDLKGLWEKEIRSEKFFARYLGGASMAEVELTDAEFERVMIEGKKHTGDIE